MQSKLIFAEFPLPMNSAGKQNNLIVVLGPTASGKTRFAALLAARIQGEIISADSRQLYKRMNIGTGKDYSDYFVDNQLIPSHLVDIYEPGYRSNVFEYKKLFDSAYRDIHSRGKKAILCGGTGMYIEAVTKEYDLIAVPVNRPLRDSLNEKSLKELEEILASYKRLHNKSDTDTTKRAIRAIEIAEYYKHNKPQNQDHLYLNPIYIGIEPDLELRRQKITNRLHARLNEGMIEEVRTLLNEGLTSEDLIYYGLEYKFITLYLTGELDYNNMIEKLNTGIHQFAKRQMTWFRKMEREGTKIHWINANISSQEKLKSALQILHKNRFIGESYLR